MSEDNSAEPPLACENCGAEMKVAHVTPKTRSFPQIVTYHCPECGHFHTIEHEDD